MAPMSEDEAPEASPPPPPSPPLVDSLVWRTYLEEGAGSMVKMSAP